MHGNKILYIYGIGKQDFNIKQITSLVKCSLDIGCTFAVCWTMVEQNILT